MQRTVERYLSEYEKVHNASTGKGCFCLGDIQKLWRYAKDIEDYTEFTYIVLQYGFMVGYKCAKRERYKK